MQRRLPYFSLFFGVASWALLGLRFTPFLGTGLGTVFLFFPLAVIGLILGIVARTKGQNKKLANLAIGINALPFAVLMLIIVLLARPDAWRQ